MTKPVHGGKRIVFFSSFGVKLSLIAWLAMLGVDFFLHAGVLAHIYTQESQFLLPPMEAFRRIPIGYLSFLIAALFLVWLAVRLGVAKTKDGILLGLGVGGVMWASLGLGMYSITTARITTLIAWTLGQSVEMACAGGLVGLALRRKDLAYSFWVSLGITVLLVAITVVMQSLGIVPIAVV